MDLPDPLSSSVRERPQLQHPLHSTREDARQEKPRLLRFRLFVSRLNRIEKVSTTGYVATSNLTTGLFVRAVLDASEKTYDGAFLNVSRESET